MQSSFVTNQLSDARCAEILDEVLQRLQIVVIHQIDLKNYNNHCTATSILSAWMKGEAIIAQLLIWCNAYNKKLFNAKADAQQFYIQSTLLCSLSKTIYRLLKQLYLAKKLFSLTGTICLDLDQSISLISGNLKSNLKRLDFLLIY
jgi:tRNA(Ile)-lysidine synthase